MNDTTAMGQEFTASVWREGQWYIAQALEIDIASQGESVETALRQPARGSWNFTSRPPPLPQRRKSTNSTQK